MRPLQWRLQPFFLHHDTYNGEIIMIDYAFGHVHNVLEEVILVLLGKIEIYQEEGGLKSTPPPPTQGLWVGQEREV
jgi:hypothetical protein